MTPSEVPPTPSAPTNGTATAPDPGLPPVKPLTAGYVVQMFLVPGLIVTGAVLVLMLLSWFNPFGATPEQFLKKLDDPNADARWRAASDLADVLTRNDGLASDAHFALGIAERLKRARDAAAPAERALAERVSRMSPEELAADKKARESDRVFIEYLAGCLGVFRVPVGMAQLMEMAESQDVADADELARRRVSALYFLANLGENVKAFEKLPPERQLAAFGALEEEAAGDGDRAKWARDALAILRGRAQGQPTMLGLDQVCARCADDPNPDVRKVAAFALGFWKGTAEEERTADDVLFRLAQRPPAGSDDSPALQVCYNAATALAMRGSDRTPVAVLVDMLDEARLQKAFRTKSPQGEGPDTQTVHATLINALQGLGSLHRAHPELDVSSARPAVEALVSHPVPRIHTEAEKTLAALKGS